MRKTIRNCTPSVVIPPKAGAHPDDCSQSMNGSPPSRGRLAPTILSLLERAFSRYIALDPEALKKLAALSGKIIKITFNDWKKSFYFSPHASGITIQSHATHRPDAEIIGTSITLLGISFANEKNSLTLAKKLEIKGDIDLAQSFHHILRNIEIDWEEPLSKLTGDVVAHQIGRFARGLKDWALQMKKNTGLNITEYLQEESKHLPSRQEVEDFFEEVSDLQHAVERLVARLDT